jgi:small redox-active disulfide protein 2
MKIEILGTGCPKCRKLFENAQEAAKNIATAADVVKVEDIQQIMNAGVMITPAIAVDGVVKSAGKVLSVDEIKKIIS